MLFGQLLLCVRKVTNIELMNKAKIKKLIPLWVKCCQIPSALISPPHKTPQTQCFLCL